MCLIISLLAFHTTHLRGAAGGAVLIAELLKAQVISLLRMQNN